VSEIGRRTGVGVSREVINKYRDAFDEFKSIRLLNQRLVYEREGERERPRRKVEAQYSLTSDNDAYSETVSSSTM